MRLEARGILITGGSEGLGLALARACVQEGAHIVICARGKGPLQKAHRELAAAARKGQRVFAQRCDVSKPSDAQRLVHFASRVLPRIHGIVNNAGVHGPIGLTEQVSWQEWVAAIRINLFGTVLLCRCILPGFRSRRYGKIVNLSGGGAAAPRPRFSAYSASKTAVVRFTETLAEEVRGAGIDVNAVAPGSLNTRLSDEASRAERKAAGHEFHPRLVKQKEDSRTALERAVALCVYLLSDASDGISGKLISAPWDPWKTLQQKREALDGSDLYTLRRIVPKDRGMDWNDEDQNVAAAPELARSKNRVAFEERNSKR